MNKFIQQQSKAINFFHKQQEKGMISHAYLIVGSQADKMADYIAMSIYCPTQSVGACMACPTCERVKNHGHADYKVFDSQENIKKENIIDIKGYFSQTSLEKNNHSIYALYDVEKASNAAMNSLLKFLEEPDTTITAILTTKTPGRVLDTIKSRCLNIYLDEFENDEVIEKFIEMGFEAAYVSSLISVYEDDESFESILENIKFKHLFDSINEFHRYYKSDPVLAGALLQADLINKEKVSLEEYKIFLNMFLEMSTIPQIKESVIRNIDRIGVGMIVNLLIDYLIVDLIQGGKE